MGGTGRCSATRRVGSDEGSRQVSPEVTDLRHWQREPYPQLLSLALLRDPVFRLCSGISLCLDELNGMFQ